MEMQIAACRRIHRQGFVTSAAPTNCFGQREKERSQGAGGCAQSCRHGQDQSSSTLERSNVKQVESSAACRSHSFPCRGWTPALLVHAQTVCAKKLKVDLSVEVHHCECRCCRYGVAAWVDTRAGTTLTVRAIAAIPRKRNSPASFITFDGLPPEAEHLATRGSQRPRRTRCHWCEFTPNASLQTCSVRCAATAHPGSSSPSRRCRVAADPALSTPGGRDIGLVAKLDACRLQDRALDTYAANRALSLPASTPAAQTCFARSGCNVSA